MKKLILVLLCLCIVSQAFAINIRPCRVIDASTPQAETAYTVGFIVLAISFIPGAMPYVAPAAVICGFGYGIYTLIKS
jgi:hypothetical protein